MKSSSSHHPQQPGALPGQPVDMGASGGQPVGEGEIPYDDQTADQKMAQPSAPPVQDMDRIKGYENIVSPSVPFITPPPPTYQEATGGTNADLWALDTNLIESEARNLLIAEAKSNLCWGKGAAETMTIKAIQKSTAVHYVLRTFLEMRSTDWASEPFRGQPIDGPQNGPPPAPWELQITPPDMFRDVRIQTEVPHTASVKSCHFCQGMMFVMCLRCRGWGRTRCNMCHGRGHQGMGDNRRRCFSCHGRGMRHCFNCRGMGRVPCRVCEARGQVKCFVQMTTLFKTYTKEFILERTELPDELIRKVSGVILFEDTRPQLQPIQSSPEPRVNQQSAGMIQEHRALAQTGRIWMQNHVIRGVPVFQCDCQWKDDEFQFFVYGNDRRVYCKDYPQTCCCGCELL